MHTLKILWSSFSRKQNIKNYRTTFFDKFSFAQGIILFNLVRRIFLIHPLYFGNNSRDYLLIPWPDSSISHHNLPFIPFYVLKFRKNLKKRKLDTRWKWRLFLKRLIRARLKMHPRQKNPRRSTPHLDNVNLFAPINLSPLNLGRLTSILGPVLLSFSENFNGKITLERQ